ncbi:DUF4349 domain-containing protein [Microbacterium sp. ET2]|uniref:DUF4349 domain-containing protein n=1 Tax=Microbacterium albipurpureum TaxID=3050384 RepID=UPI00259D0921|nr:DUF4349 domain-containing protein [Microbacterium sp. ET2 (Ac-2212)]WJL95802.1 DUF4349 domain-containing protein [Microbacterium sp. ET2 (Ac-2212)]
MNTTERAPLPDLSDERIDRIETGLFAGIEADRRTRRRRRRTGWISAGAAAAVIVVAAAIAPAVGGIVSPMSSNESAVTPAGGDAVTLPLDQRATSAESGAADDLGTAEGGASAVEAPAGRDIITTASASIVVDDVPAAAGEVGDAATAIGGYVQSQSIGQSGTPIPIEPGTGGPDVSYPSPYAGESGWVTVRIPAQELSGFVSGLAGIGEITQSSIDRQDVTEQTVDLRARVEATQASVDRLEELLAQAGDLGDLIAAESALAERQATLESYQQQLESLEGQVELSTVSVSLSPRVEQVTADPAGFTDGLLAGWNGLIATLNGIVIAFGFLIPWLVVLGVVGLIVWGVIRLRRARRERAAGDRSTGEQAAPDA